MPNLHSPRLDFVQGTKYQQINFYIMNYERPAQFVIRHPHDTAHRVSAKCKTSVYNSGWKSPFAGKAPKGFTESAPTSFAEKQGENWELK